MNEYCSPRGGREATSDIQHCRDGEIKEWASAPQLERSGFLPRTRCAVAVSEQLLIYRPPSPGPSSTQSRLFNPICGRSNPICGRSNTQGGPAKPHSASRGRNRSEHWTSQTKRLGVGTFRRTSRRIGDGCRPVVNRMLSRAPRRKPMCIFLHIRNEFFMRMQRTALSIWLFDNNDGKEKGCTPRSKTGGSWSW